MGLFLPAFFAAAPNFGFALFAAFFPVDFRGAFAVACKAVFFPALEDDDDALLGFFFAAFFGAFFAVATLLGFAFTEGDFFCLRGGFGPGDGASWAGGDVGSVSPAASAGR